MVNYLIRRLLLMIPTLLGITFMVFMLLALAPGRSGTFNLGNGAGYSVREVISACERVSGRKIPIVQKPRRLGDAPRLVASADRALRELGWQPKFPHLDAIVASAWSWHRRHPEGYAD